jgi:hypothetical protein
MGGGTDVGKRLLIDFSPLMEVAGTRVNEELR